MAINKLISNRTHKIVGGGCDTCGVCHPNRCFTCDGGGYKCDKGGSKFVPMRKFRSFDGVSADDKNVNEIQKSILGLVSVGILFFVIGYSYSKGKEKA